MTRRRDLVLSEADSARLADDRAIGGSRAKLLRRGSAAALIGLALAAAVVIALSPGLRRDVLDWAQNALMAAVFSLYSISDIYH